MIDCHSGEMSWVKGGEKQPPPTKFTSTHPPPYKRDRNWHRLYDHFIFKELAYFRVRIRLTDDFNKCNYSELSCWSPRLSAKIE